MAVAGVYLDGPSAGTDTELDDPLRRPRPSAPPVVGFDLPKSQRLDLRVDPGQPQGVPDAQSVQAFQVGRQVIEHIFDSMLMIPASRPRVFDFVFDNVGHRR